MSEVRGALFSLLLVGTSAHAFTLETSGTVGCHERVTEEAVRRAGWRVARPVITPADRELESNMPVHLPADWEPWMMAAVIGVRDNDLHGAAVTDLVAHPWEDYSSEDQKAHCLRAPEDQNTTGDFEALTACREFIRSELATAAAAKDSDVENVSVALKFETVTVPVAKAPYHLGQAMHAVQDSFAHTYRSEDFTRVLTVFNYVAPVLGRGYSEPRDGHAHQSTLDRCDTSDEFGAARYEAAVEASADLLRAVQLQSGESAAEKGAAAVDHWLTLQPGCTAENGWCGAEARYSIAERATGCSSAPGAAWWGLFAVLGVFWRRRVRARAQP